MGIYPDKDSVYVPSDIANKSLLYGLSRHEKGVIETKVEIVDGVPVKKHRLIIAKISIGDTVYVHPESMRGEQVIADFGHEWKVVDIRGSKVALQSTDYMMWVDSEKDDNYQILAMVDDSNIKPEPFNAAKYTQYSIKE